LSHDHLHCVEVISLHLQVRDPAVALNQEDAPGPAGRPDPQIRHQGLMRIMAQIDDPVLGALAVFDQDLPMLEVQNIERELGDLLHPPTASQHQHEHGPVALSFDRLKEALHLLILQVPRQRPGHLQRMILPDRIDDVQDSLIPQVVIELAANFVVKDSEVLIVVGKETDIDKIK